VASKTYSMLYGDAFMVVATKRSIKVQEADITSPAPLAIPTDPTSNQVSEFINAVDPIIADTVALHIKLKNFK
jgi:hypothetical protein